MKTLSLCICLFLSIHFSAFSKENSINPVIKNESFVKTYGYEPNEFTPEVLRIKTHLAYVEKLLKGKDISNLSKQQKKNRQRCLQLLHKYWSAGIFPKNKKYDERKPCFIDDDGRICAVGYLVEQTAGRDVAEYINSKFQYANIKEMELKELEDWVSQSGLSLEECAMIQPNYPWSVHTLSPAFTITSVLFSGTNALASGTNLYHYFSKDGKRKSAVFGMFLGTLQTGWGLINYGTQKNNFYLDDAPRNYFILNTICGLGGIASASLNLFGNVPKKIKNNVGFYTYPAKDKIAFGISFRNIF